MGKKLSAPASESCRSNGPCARTVTFWHGISACRFIRSALGKQSIQSWLQLNHMRMPNNRNGPLETELLGRAKRKRRQVCLHPSKSATRSMHPSGYRQRADLALSDRAAEFQAELVPRRET